MISKRSLLLILYLAITGCTMDCVEPGLQSRNTSVNVDVPVRKADEGIEIHWVDSKQVISNGEKIKFNLSGAVNFCPSKEGQNPRKVLVPAGFCADGSEPNYSKAANINNVPNSYGIDEHELCGGKDFGSDRRYVDTGIKVNPGDKLNFSLVPRKVIIDYVNPKREHISFDDNCYKSEQVDKDKATREEILNGGNFYCISNGNRTSIQFPHISKDQQDKMKRVEVLIGNGYTPYDNKVHFNKDYITNRSPWMYGSLLDLRHAKIGLNELCDGKNCDFNEIKKYSSYELNCYYQNICYTKRGIWNANIGEQKSNCVSSIRYSKYDKGNKCDMYSYVKEREKNSKVDDFTEDNHSWAEALVAKIGDLDNKDTAKGNQCLPEREEAENDLVCSKINNNFEHFSLKLNHDYKVNEEVNPGNSVMLAIADYKGYNLNRGGYHVKVTKSCEYMNGEKLYVYLGNEPPKHISDTNDLQEVKNLQQVTEDNIKYYVIDGSNLEKDKSKKIYFGIDVSYAKINEIMNEENRYYENNKYSVTLFIKRKVNNFISSNINKLFGFINELFKGSSEDLYTGYIKGLLQGVRALLTIYVIFTVVGYMLGTIQLSKFDFIVRIMKIAFIAFAFSNQSWEFFGATLSKLFVDSSIYLVDSFSGYIGEGDKKFAFLDLTAGVLFTGETWVKFLSLMLAGPFGFIAFLIILHASFTFLKCIISATFKYVISTILVAFLLSLTPLFIVFILFQQTKSLFDNWIKTLAHVALQPVILFSSLSLLNQLMYSVLYNLTNFSACYQCLISVNFLSYDLCLMKSILPLGYSPGTSVDIALSNGWKTGGHFAALPIDLIQAFIYLIIAIVMEAFVRISETMAQTIFSSGWGVAGSVSGVAQSASQSILSAVGLDDRTQGMIQNIRQQVGKDRLEVEAKLPIMQPKALKQEDSKESSRIPKSNTSEQLKSSKESGLETENKKGNGE